MHSASYIKSKLQIQNGYYFGLLLLAIGLPFSNFLMSISQFVMLGFWLVEGNLKSKLGSFFHNKIALIVTFFFVLHLIGLIYSTDFVYGFEDVRKKIPLLLLPLIISTSEPLSRKKLHQILMVFIASVLMATFVSCFVLLGFTGKNIVDIRHISIFVSHIRFSLMVCFASFISFYFFWQNVIKKVQIVFLALGIWFVLFLGVMESMTGTVIFLIVSFSVLVRKIWLSKNRSVKIRFSMLVFTIAAALLTFLILEVKQYNQLNIVSHSVALDHTVSGEKYVHDLHNNEVENNTYIWRNIATQELQLAWNQRSDIGFNEKDLKGNNVDQTLIRFLTSKGLNKDFEGVWGLSEDEIVLIENGVPNVSYQNMAKLRVRLRMVIWEIDNYFKGNNPTGHSLAMRFEFWKTGMSIVKDNFIFGVGTGDVKNAFKDEYDKVNSPLGAEWRLRAHNQYLEIGVGLGILGLLYFLFSLIYPIIIVNNGYLYFVFFVISVASMINEDTLETQAGVTFFAFFNSLLLFGSRKKDSDIS